MLYNETFGHRPGPGPGIWSWSYGLYIIMASPTLQLSSVLKTIEIFLPKSVLIFCVDNSIFTLLHSEKYPSLLISFYLVIIPTPELLQFRISCNQIGLKTTLTLNPTFYIKYCVQTKTTTLSGLGLIHSVITKYS